MKVFSFCLYGNNPIYTIGAIENLKIINTLFPDWKTIVSYANNVDPIIISELRDNGAILIEKDYKLSFTGMFWRFLPISFDDVEVMVSRDCDSRVSERDVACLEEFLSSSYDYNIIRDHPIGHYWRINGGMWATKKTEYIVKIDSYVESYLRKFQNIIGTDSALNDSIRNHDQIFLSEVIYPNIVNNCLIHDEYFKYENNCKAINHDRKSNNFAFIGESIDENNEPRGDQRSQIIKIYNENLQ